MKIGILTQPLQLNYGGLLQAFALQKVLKNMGHSVKTINITYRKSAFKDLRGILSRIFHKYFLSDKSILHIFPNRPTLKQMELITQHTSNFIQKNIDRTEPIPLGNIMNHLNKYHFNAYIVGSDQVWRPRYSPGIPTFFLDFLHDSNIKRIAYAASFGVDNWEYNKRLTKKCRNLSKKFHAISVREISGLQLCRQFLNVSATHLLDPTFLLEKENYIDLVHHDNIPPKPNSLMVYILDETKDKDLIIEKIIEIMNLEINSILPKNSLSKKCNKNINDYIFPQVTAWLRGFMDAEYVITDSFHGTIFSIIFNKPFIVIGNKARGLTRFSSLLKIFELENRMISCIDELTEELIHSPINFERVNKIINLEKSKSLNFLDKHLSNI